MMKDRIAIALLSMMVCALAFVGSLYSADTKVTAMTAVTSFEDTDVLYVVRPGTGDRKITAANMKADVRGSNTAITLFNSDDPDLTVTGQISWDTDGWLRVTSNNGTTQKAIAAQDEIHVTVYKTQDMDDAQRDHFWIWSNESGMSFIVTGWKGWSTSDDTTLTIYEEDADGANDATVDADEIATGSGPYTGSDTTITGATIENGHLLYLDFDDTDAPAMVKITIYGYYNADVN